MTVAAVVVALTVAGAASAPCAGDPRGGLTIGVENRHGGSTPTIVRLSGRLIGGPCGSLAAAGSTYDVTLQPPASCTGTCSCGEGTSCSCEAGGVPRCERWVDRLAPGEWLHRVEVSASGQRQARRSLLMAEPSPPAALRWTAFRSVLTVRSGADDGSPGTLRHALTAAAGGVEAPALIQFEHPPGAGPLIVRLSDPAQLRIPSETVIDGTDLDGQPSPLAPFADRAYRTVIELDPRDSALAHAATIRITAPDSGLRGVYLRRILGAEAAIARLDQDLLAFGPGARRGFVDICRLDGGSAHRAMQDCPANNAMAARNPAQGKDCVDVEATGQRDFGDAVVVSDSELRHCYDRAVKSQDAATVVRRSWIHHNGRGGLFAQNPRGRLQAIENLVEENGRNCPAAARCDGGPRHGLSCCAWGL